jgi:hypothetical protein
MRRSVLTAAVAVVGAGLLRPVVREQRTVQRPGLRERGDLCEGQPGQWVYEPFNDAYAPGTKKFDFDINEVSYSAARAQAVTFSDSYYDVTQALVALKSSPIATVPAPARGPAPRPQPHGCPIDGAIAHVMGHPWGGFAVLAG